MLELEGLPKVPVLKSKLEKLGEKDAILNTQGKAISSSESLHQQSEIPDQVINNNLLPTPTSLGASVSAEAILVYDINSKTPMIAKNPNKKLPPASTAKLMTALVALETYSPETLLKFTPSDFRFGYNKDFQVGEEMTVKDLITVMLVESANEAAFNLARNHPQGEAGFIKRMNEKAKETGLKNTHFTNPAGFDNPNHYSTANDLNRLAAIATQDPMLKKIVKLKKAEISDFSRRFKHNIASTNKLLLYNPQVIGVKTGTTPGAKEVLITQFKLDDERVLQITVMGSEDRYEDTLKLYDLAIRNFQWVSVESLVKKILKS